MEARPDILILAGRTHPALAEAVASHLAAPPGRRTLERFPDGELGVSVHEDLRGRRVCVLQSARTGEDLLELLLLADACWRLGARHLTAVLPYLPYARQDRRTSSGDALGGRVVADLVGTRFQRALAVDLHEAALEGFFSVPLEHHSAVPVLSETLRKGLPPRPVLVAPDLGAAKLAERYAERLDLPVAHVHKVRRDGEDVRVRRVTGDVEGRAPVLVDDMISTGGTMVSATQALLERGCSPRVTLVATHGLFAGRARERLGTLPLERIVVTDSLPQGAEPGLPLEVAGLGPTLARALGGPPT